MSQLKVDLGERSYPIMIREGLLSSTQEWSSYIGKQVLIVSNETLYEPYAKPLKAQLANHNLTKLDVFALPDGEQYKSLETVNSIFDYLLEAGFNRTVTLIALGGGVVGDMTGFAAACYQRGVNFVQVPTTLLSQVDSSVGGKTGVNHPLGKNMIGAFYQPKCVVIDLKVLNTIPDKELSAGLAEVVKYGLIYDAEFFNWLEEHAEALFERDLEKLSYAIHQSCKIKAEVVANDEKESGLRAILNLGHTFGHAIEAHQGYGVWLHGEAVAVGMMMACDLSRRLDWIDQSVCERLERLNRAFNLPVASPENMASQDFEKYMILDKKVLNNKIRLVLLKSLGKACVTEDFDGNLLQETLEHFCS